MCGIIGVSLDSEKDDCCGLLLDGLLALQHRGQESAGISIVSNGKIETRKAMGLVSNLDSSGLSDGRGGIGHVRYSTTGSSTISNAQPFGSSDWGFALAFNGNITNYHELRGSLPGKFETGSDCEVIVRLLESELNNGGGATLITVRKALEALCSRLDGSYSLLVLLRDGTLAALRDPLGFKPLSVGKLGDGWAVASETCALDSLSASQVSDVEPGEAVVISKGKMERNAVVVKETKHAHCMFEFVYFARPDSVVEGKPVYVVREMLGEALASANGIGGDVVVPVPDSGRCCASGFSYKSGIPMKEGLMKNRYVHRTFIMPHQDSRESGVTKKLNPIRSILSGKEVVLVDDSIVRGTTMKKIIWAVRKAGATKVHVGISCPKIVAPCYMGIDFPTYRELAASGVNEEDVRKTIGADTLRYNSIDSLKGAIGFDDLCLACLTGDYPVSVGENKK